MKNVDHYFFFNYIYKMSEETYYQRNRDVIINRAKDYYKDDKKD